MLKQLRCGHFKKIKARPAKNWSPLCHECLRKVSPIRVYPLREQLKGEWLENHWGQKHD